MTRLLLTMVLGAVASLGAQTRVTTPKQQLGFDLGDDYQLANDPQLRRFAEAGGTIIAIGSSAQNIAAHLQLPVENHLVENGVPLPSAKYFVPGSVLTARVDTTHPLAAGMRERTDFFFDNSPVFRIRPGAAGIRPIATFDTATPLRSGWAWGQKYIEGGVLAIEATMGNGRVLLYGPEILHRAQPHGTFKLLFNSIYSSVMQVK